MERPHKIMFARPCIYLCILSGMKTHQFVLVHLVFAIPQLIDALSSGGVLQIDNTYLFLTLSDGM